MSRWPEISRSSAHSTTYPQVMTLPKLASRVGGPWFASWVDPLPAGIEEARHVSRHHSDHDRREPSGGRRRAAVSRCDAYPLTQGIPGAGCPSSRCGARSRGAPAGRGLGRVVAAVEVQALTGIVTMIDPLPQHPDLHGCDQFPRQVQRDAGPVGSRPARPSRTDGEGSGSTRAGFSVAAARACAWPGRPRRPRPAR